MKHLNVAEPSHQSTQVPTFFSFFVCQFERLTHLKWGGNEYDPIQSLMLSSLQNADTVTCYNLILILTRERERGLENLSETLSYESSIITHKAKTKCFIF